MDGGQRPNAEPYQRAAGGSAGPGRVPASPIPPPHNRWRATAVEPTQAVSAQIGAAGAPTNAIDLPLTVRDVRYRTHDFNTPSQPFAARDPMTLWQLKVLIVMLGIWVGAALVDYRLPLAITLVCLTVSFAIVTMFRSMALVELWRSRKRRDQRRPAPMPLWRPATSLPVYSILVALYREAEVVGDLLAALEAIDYPHDKLDVILVVEPDDLATSAAILARRTNLPLRVVVATPTGPRTKPKALNCALPYVRGAYTVIYDAEDRPERDQLRKALDVFEEAQWNARHQTPPVASNLVCVQAELNIYNARDSWLTRQFAIEYSTLFSAILPSMSRWQWPIPLGGTSNHFQTDALLQLGGWDPYNVTEDADLGIRIARRGWTTAVVKSTTWEEAPRTFRDWLKQRTRWIKGWIVTFLVHTRAPSALVDDLGARRTLAFAITLGGMILSSFCNPLAWLTLGAWLSGWLTASGPSPDGSEVTSFAGAAIVVVAAANLVVGYVLAMMTAAIATRRYHGRLAWHALTLPLYWLLLSLAAVRATSQLRRNPHTWEKTPHGKSRAHLARQSRRN